MYVDRTVGSQQRINLQTDVGAEEVLIIRCNERGDIAANGCANSAVGCCTLLRTLLCNQRYLPFQTRLAIGHQGDVGRKIGQGTSACNLKIDRWLARQVQEARGNAALIFHQRHIQRNLGSVPDHVGLQGQGTVYRVDAFGCHIDVQPVVIQARRRRNGQSNRGSQQRLTQIDPGDFESGNIDRHWQVGQFERETGRLGRR